MNGYVSISEACNKAMLSHYQLNKLIEEGKVRIKDTTDITKRSSSRLRSVCLQDIFDAKSGIVLPYIDISDVGEIFDLTPGSARYLIKSGRLRWRRENSHTQLCRSDLELFVKDAQCKPAGRPKGSISRSA